MIALYNEYSAAGFKYSDEVKAIIAKTDAWTADEYKTVVQANLDAYTSLT